MELYKIIATLNNTSETYEFVYLPENFEGVEIEQKFSFVYPIGFTPKASIDTMRICLSDKLTIDDVFDTYGLFASVDLEIQKLNVNGISYDHLADFAIDFESYQKMSDYSEFALKSISVADTYESKKNTEIEFPLFGQFAYMPNTLKYTNYVSLKSKGSVETDRTYFKFEQNNASKIYNTDASLFHPTNPDYEEVIYYLGDGTPTERLYLKLSSRINLKFIGSNKTDVQVNLYKVSGSSLIFIHNFLTTDIVSTGTSVAVDFNTTEINCGICTSGDFFIIATNKIISATITGELFVDIKRKTTVKLITSGTNKFRHRSANLVLTTIFNNQIDLDEDYIGDISVTSANELARGKSYLTIKPSEFISELCRVAGLIFNFKSNGRAEIIKISDYFDNLLKTENAIEITDYQDLTIDYCSDLNIGSVMVGQEQKTTTVYPYSLNWQKKLVFSQTERQGDTLDISVNKYRLDFAGMIDYYLKRSEQNDANLTDVFLFKPDYWRGSNNEPELIYDGFTPRDFLTNNSRFLSFIFQNFGKNTLINTSNGGTDDELYMSMVGQMENFELTETPRLLPIQYEFTCIIDMVDFSENIIKINHEGEDIYIFVTIATTTDKLTEQKITGLKIQL